MKSLPEKTDIVLYTTLIKTWTSNSFPRERLLSLHATYSGFNSLLKPILQLCPCAGEKLDPIIHVGIMRCGDHYPSNSTGIPYQIGHSGCWENPYRQDIRPG
jgi:hypothetical protein